MQSLCRIALEPADGCARLTVSVGRRLSSCNFKWVSLPRTGTVIYFVFSLCSCFEDWKVRKLGLKRPYYKVGWWDCSEVTWLSPKPADPSSTGLSCAILKVIHLSHMCSCSTYKLSEKTIKDCKSLTHGYEPQKDSVKTVWLILTISVTQAEAGDL